VWLAVSGSEIEMLQSLAFGRVEGGTATATSTERVLRTCGLAKVGIADDMYWLAACRAGWGGQLLGTSTGLIVAGRRY
jgi:hypothetical protein